MRKRNARRAGAIRVRRRRTKSRGSAPVVSSPPRWRKQGRLELVSAWSNEEAGEVFIKTTRRITANARERRDWKSGPRRATSACTLPPPPSPTGRRRAGEAGISVKYSQDPAATAFVDAHHHRRTVAAQAPGAREGRPRKEPRTRRSGGGGEKEGPKPPPRRSGRREAKRAMSEEAGGCQEMAGESRSRSQKHRRGS